MTNHKEHRQSSEPIKFLWYSWRGERVTIGFTSDWTRKLSQLPFLNQSQRTHAKFHSQVKTAHMSIRSLGEVLLLISKQTSYSLLVDHFVTSCFHSFLAWRVYSWFTARFLSLVSLLTCYYLLAGWITRHSDDLDAGRRRSAQKRAIGQKGHGINEPEVLESVELADWSHNTGAHQNGENQVRDVCHNSRTSEGHIWRSGMMASFVS